MAAVAAATRVQKSKPNVYFAITCYKLFKHFHQIRHVAAAMNAEQCALKFHFSWPVYTHYLVTLRETK